MVAKKKTITEEVAPYGLDPMFEVIVAELASSRPSFWGRIGHEIDPDRFTHKGAKLVLRACKAASAEGAPPAHPAVVLQRVRSWLEAGKVDATEYKEVKYICEAAIEDAAAYNEESIIKELAGPIKRVLEKTALESGFSAWGRRAELDQTERLLERAKRVGVTDISVGLHLGVATVQNVVDRNKTVLRGTGIDDLDLELRGGVRRGTMTIVTGSTGTGKSMFIDHMVAHAISQKTPSAIATLELSEQDHQARIIGNLCDVPYEDITRYPEVEQEASLRMNALIEDGIIAFCTVKYFTAGAATVADLEQWLDVEEMINGVKIEVLAVDYATLLAANPKTRNAARHEQITEIAKDLRALAVRRNLWLISPNQANGEGMDSKKTKILQNHHVAESKGIPKNADYHFTINPRDDGSTVVYHIAKNRYGVSNLDVGPLPHEFEKGRASSVVRRGWPW